MSIILYHAFVIPYRFCFKARAFGSLKIYEFLMDVFFMIDMALSFLTGYYKKGNIIMKRGPIVRHYMRTWFVIDLLATFPWSWFFADRNIDYWPDDDFDETADINNGVFHSMVMGGQVGHNFLDTEKFVDRLSDFDIAQTVRLMKLIRFIKIIRVT